MAEKCDVVLVNPGDRRRVFQSLGRELSAIEPPVWAGLIGRHLRNQGLSVRIIDANAEGLEAEDTASNISVIKPVLAVVVVYGHQPSASTQNMPAAGAVCRALAKAAPSVPVLMLGGHVSALPKRTLEEEACTFTCQGEGPATIVALVKALKSRASPDLSKVPGLWYRAEGGISNNPPAPLITDVDRDLGGMAWDMLPMHLYRAHNWHCYGQPSRQPYAAIYTSFGCPFDCTFCCINVPFGGRGYRCRSPQNVADELDILVRQYGVRNIKFADELFVLKKEHVEGICDLIIERGYDLNIWAYARVDTVSDMALLAKLRRAGITWLALGIESGSERVLADAHKRTRKKQIAESCKRISEAGINIIGNYIFGLPEDDLASMRETLDLAKELNCEFANFYCAMAYPGSKLHETVTALKWQLPDNWSGYSQHAYDCLPLPTKYLSSGDVLKFRDEAFVEYFSSERYQQMVLGKFGQVALDDVKMMLGHRLERKFTTRK